MKKIFNHNTPSIKLKPQIFLGLSLLFILYSFSAFSNHEIEERLYSKMSDKKIEVATENLLAALETKEDGTKHKWKSGHYSGYIIPITTIINEEGYFCRNYMEVLIRYSEYNIYENQACRDHDGEWVWIETSNINKSEGRKKTLADLFKKH